MDYFNSQGFADRVNELLAEWHAPGLAVAVIQDGSIQSRGFGKSNIDTGEPVTPDTLFDIASSSKSLTAASVALLVEDEDLPEVKWDALMSDLLPDEFILSSEQYTKDIMLDDVLGHRTGLTGHDLTYFGLRSDKPDTLETITQNLKNLPIAFPVRSKYEYNNMMYTIASYLVEKKSNQPFSAFLHKDFFAPLSMTSTNLQPNAAIEAGLKDRLATPYTWNEERKTLKACEMQQTPEAQGAGSIITSVNDYIKWVKALMYQEPPISPEVYKALTKPRTIQNPEMEDELKDFYSSPVLYCAGLEKYHYRGYEVVKHDGLIAGFASCHFFLPELKFGGVALANSSSGSDVVDIVCSELIDRFMGTPAELRPDWNALQHKREQHYKDEEKENDEKYEGPHPPLSLPLSTYTGTYLNKGYRHLKIEDRNGKLFIDANDRSFGFTLTFDHLNDGTAFVAHLCDYWEGGDEKVDAEFRFEGGRVVQMGLKLEIEMEEMIWFDRVEEVVMR